MSPKLYLMCRHDMQLVQQRAHDMFPNLELRSRSVMSLLTECFICLLYDQDNRTVRLVSIAILGLILFNSS